MSQKRCKTLQQRLRVSDKEGRIRVTVDSTLQEDLEVLKSRAGGEKVTSLSVLTVFKAVYSAVSATDYQAVALTAGDGVTLGLVEFIQKVGDIHRSAGYPGIAMNTLFAGDGPPANVFAMK